MTDPDARLLAYADGELAPADAAEVERELASQPELRERLDEVRRFQERLRGGLPPVPTYDPAQRQTFTDRLAFAVGAARTRRHWRRVRIAAAACLLVGVSGLLAVPAVRGMRVVESISNEGDHPAISAVRLTPPGSDGLSGYKTSPIDTGQSATRPLEPQWRAVGTGSATYAPIEGQDGRTNRVLDQVVMETEQEQAKGREEARAHSELDARQLMMAKRGFAAKPSAATLKDKAVDERSFDGVSNKPNPVSQLDVPEEYFSRERNNELQHSASVARSIAHQLNLKLAEIDDDENAAQGPVSGQSLQPPGGTNGLHPDRAKVIPPQIPASPAGSPVAVDGTEIAVAKRESDLAGAQSQENGAATAGGRRRELREWRTLLTDGEDDPAKKEIREQEHAALADEVRTARQELSRLEAFATDAIPARADRLPTVTNPWTLAERDARSTFALDTDRASYALARRHLGAGTLPPAATVRVEEFVNAFDYHDHAPEVDAFALRAEAAPAPFCQGATLLRVGLKGRIAGRDGRRPAHLVLVVDASGSMDRPDRGAVAKAGLLAALDALAADDRVTLVAFNAEARLLAEALPAGDPALRRAFDAIPAQGASNLAAGLGLGYAQAVRGYRPGAVNRVVLVSDGIANLGETGLEQLVAAAEANRRQGIATTTVGVGAGSYDDALLARLAKRGDGHYLRLDEDADSRAAFVADLGAGLQTIAADAKIQVTFDPARVRRWRLLGYEQRALAHQDFANDAVDAGEVGSGQAATALYELELIGDAGTDLGSVHVRYRDPADGAVHERAWRLAGDLPRSRTVAEAPAFYLAAAAAEFAELLRGSEHAADGSFPALIAVLERVAAVWPHDAGVADLLRLARAAPGLPPAP